MNEPKKSDDALEKEFAEAWLVEQFTTPGGMRTKAYLRKVFNVDRPVFVLGEPNDRAQFRDGTRVFPLQLEELIQAAKKAAKPKQRKAKS